MKKLNEEEQSRIKYLTEIIRSKSASERFKAINEIGFNTENSYLAIPALIESFEYISSSYTGQTLWALHNFGKIACPYLLSALKSDSKRIRFYACCLLPNEYYSEIEPIIIPLLKDDDFDDRRNISWFFNRRDERFIPLIRVLLTDENPRVRYLIVNVLDFLDKKIVVSLLPELEELLRHPDSSFYDRILYGLIRIGNEAKQLLPVIIEKLDFRYPEVPFYAALVLASIGSDAKEAIPKLLQKMKDTDKNDLKTVFAFALIKIEGKHNEGMDVLLELYREGHLYSGIEREFKALLNEYKIDGDLLEIERKTRKNIQLTVESSKNISDKIDEISKHPESEMKSYYVEKLEEVHNSYLKIRDLLADQQETTNELIKINKETSSTLHLSQQNQFELSNRVGYLMENPHLTEDQRREIIGKRYWYFILVAQLITLISGIFVEIFSSDISELNYIGISILGVLVLFTIILTILISKNKI